MGTRQPPGRAIPITTGGEIRVPHGSRLLSVAAAIRRAGYRLITNPRGRIVAEPLH